MSNMSKNTKYLANKLYETGKFELINKDATFPLVAVTLKNCDFTAFQLSDKLREKGWIIPAYTLPPNAEDISVLRMVIKENFGRDMVEMLINDIMEGCERLEKSYEEKLKKKNHSLLY
jgi:glutamate decarboxylase